MTIERFARPPRLSLGATALVALLVSLGVNIATSRTVVVQADPHVRDAWFQTLSGGDARVLSTFRANTLLVDSSAQVAPKTAFADANRVFNIGGPWQNIYTVGSDSSEVFLQTLTGSGHPSTSDVCGVVVRNHVNFDTSGGANQACALYGESSGSATGSGAFIQYGVRGYAANGTSNYALYCDAGSLRCDAGATLGPTAVVGSLAQQDGDVSLNFGGAGGAGSGTTTIKGNTHISGNTHTFIADGTGEFGGALTADANLRVNGSANLAGGAGLVFLQSINSSGIPIPTSNSIAFTPARYSTSTAADPTLGLIIVTGTGTNLTLADGTKDGQMWHLSVKSGTGQVTPAHLNGGTKYTWSAVGQSLILAWDATAGSWVQVGNSGMTLV